MDRFSSHPLYKRHNIDSALNSLGAFYIKKFLILFITSFIMSLGIQYITLTFNFKDLQPLTDPVALIEQFKGLFWPMLLISLVSLLFTTILHYYVIYNPLDNTVSIFIAAYKSLKYFIPYLIIIILLAFLGSFAMLLGLVVFIIGIFFAIVYVATLYLFVLPVLMVEGPFIGNAISRTFTLVHRNFWSNIGWVAIFLTMLIVISLILSGIILIPFSGSFLKTITKPEEAVNAMDFMTNPVYLILSALVSALYLPFMPIFATILYFNGKAREENTEAAHYAGDDPEKVRVEDLYARPDSDDHPEK